MMASDLMLVTFLRVLCVGSTSLFLQIRSQEEYSHVHYVPKLIFSVVPVGMKGNLKCFFRLHDIRFCKHDEFEAT
jgi:hypothetical protein